MPQKPPSKPTVPDDFTPRIPASRIVSEPIRPKPQPAVAAPARVTTPKAPPKEPEAPPPGPPELNKRQAKFVDGVLEHGNAARAAREAGYKESNAKSTAVEIQTNPNVQRTIQLRAQSNAEQAGIRQVGVLRQVLLMATADPRKLVDAKGAPIPLQLLSDDIAAAISGVDIVPTVHRVTLEDGTTETRTEYAYRYKLADKNSAAEKLMKHLGLFEKDNNQQSGGLASLMRDIHAQGNRIPIKPNP